MKKYLILITAFIVAVMIPCMAFAEQNENEIHRIAVASDRHGNTESIAKAANRMTVTAKTKTVKYSKVRKAKKTLAPLAVKNADGKVTYKKLSGSKKLKVNAKNGKVQVAKGTKKGTYKTRIKVTAKGDVNHTALSETKTVTIKIG